MGRFRKMASISTMGAVKYKTITEKNAEHHHKTVVKPAQQQARAERAAERQAQWEALSPEQKRQTKIVGGVVAAVVIGGIAAANIFGGGSSAQTEQKVSGPTISVTEAMTYPCDTAASMHRVVAGQLGAYVEGVFKSSWDTDQARRRLDGEGVRDEYHAVLRTLDNRSMACLKQN